MPNWCDTHYIVKGSKEEIEQLNSIMKKVSEMEKPSVENRFGTRFLGCLLNELGFDYKKVDCRGEFYDNIITSKGNLDFYTYTAWSPCNETIDCIKNKFPSLVFYYYSSEPGCRYYVTNDFGGVFFNKRFNVSYFDPKSNEQCDESFETFDDVISFINDLYKSNVKTVDDINKLSEELGKENEYAYIELNEITVVQ